MAQERKINDSSRNAIKGAAKVVGTAEFGAAGGAAAGVAADKIMDGFEKFDTKWANEQIGKMTHAIKEIKGIQFETQNDLQKNRQRMHQVARQKDAMEKLLQSKALTIFPYFAFLAMLGSAAARAEKKDLILQTARKSYRSEKLSELADIAQDRLNIIKEAQKRGIELSPEAKEKFDRDLVSFILDEDPLDFSVDNETTKKIKVRDGRNTRELRNSEVKESEEQE